MTTKEKLLLNGFKQAPYDYHTYLLAFNKDFNLVCVLDKAGYIQEWYIENKLFFTSQEQIDTLQIAFNNLKRDIEELKNEVNSD